MPPPEATQVAPEPPFGRPSGRLRRSGSVRLRRQHGLQPPLHPLQLCGWLALAALAGGALLLLIPTLPPHAQPAAAAAVSVLLLEETYAKLNFTTPPPLPSSLPSSDAAFLAVVAALGLLAAITAGLLLHLCFFHIYISFLGLTTYEYIRQQRQTNNQPAVSQIEMTHSDPDGETDARTSTLRHRPVNLQCDGRTRTTFFSCTVLEESFSNCNPEPTPTPPTTPQDCQMCIMGNNSGTPHCPISFCAFISVSIALSFLLSNLQGKGYRIPKYEYV
ncbi:hypothetical protein GWI33_013357 [Rhynchophorus ferrugineus]|uniref:Uncharacterized protein n=1 Tax=Rhynchophorus ferrugineus TaxID=354439 RepID=A0A834IH65_RHYFE|nr:hypothetical protein GWI33_013357 [Rhynchophorus ferrugineus]